LKIFSISLIFALTVQFAFLTPRANAFFGGASNIPYLIKLVAQAIKQYQQLRTLVKQAKSTENLLKMANSGIDEALSYLDTLPIKDENILGEIKNFRRAISEIEKIYGGIPPGQDYNMLSLHDKTIAESLKISGTLKDYAEKQERLAKSISHKAGSSSPKGAARINAQTNAAILHTLNQILRINGQLLKLHSEEFAMANKKGKESAIHYQKVSSDLENSMIGFKGDFKTPTFKE